MPRGFMDDLEGAICVAEFRVGALGDKLRRADAICSSAAVLFCNAQDRG